VFHASQQTQSALTRYRADMIYFFAWLQLRYALFSLTAPATAGMLLQFARDHLECRDDGGHGRHQLPEAIDDELCRAKIKLKPGAQAYKTVSGRLYTIAKWHRLNDWIDPSNSAQLKTLLSDARKPRVPTSRAKVRSASLPAMLATCTDGIHGVRDRALLLLAWQGGRWSWLRIIDLRRSDIAALAFTAASPTHSKLDRRFCDPAKIALDTWLAVLPNDEGPLFRRLYSNGKISSSPLTAGQVARIVQRRARLAGIAIPTF